MIKSSQLLTKDGKIISIMSLFSLHQIVIPIVSEAQLINITSKLIAIAPQVKPETKALWLRKIRDDH